MSLIKKIAVVALVVTFTQCAATQAQAKNPFEKFFASAGKKVVGKTYNSVSKNVGKSSKLILKSVPYALLQGSSSRGNRSGASNSFQGVTNGAIGQINSGNYGKKTTTWQNVKPSYQQGSFKRPIYFRSSRR